MGLNMLEYKTVAKSTTVISSKPNIWAICLTIIILIIEYLPFDLQMFVEEYI